MARAKTTGFGFIGSSGSANLLPAFGEAVEGLNCHSGLPKKLIEESKKEKTSWPVPWLSSGVVQARNWGGSFLELPLGGGDVGATRDHVGKPKGSNPIV